MCSLNAMLIATWCAVVALVVARPHSDERTDPPHLLADVLNKTMCPMRIVYDDNPERVPRLIKHIKCDNTPNIVCARAPVGCCRHHHNVPKKDLRFESKCGEIEDTVLVTYRNSPVPQTMQVSVGCACMLHVQSPLDKAGALHVP